MQQDIARVYGPKSLHRHSRSLLRAASVVVDDLDIERVIVLPSEADTPLLVDPDAVLTHALTRSILGWECQGGRRHGAQVRAPLAHPPESGISEVLYFLARRFRDARYLVWILCSVLFET